MITHFRLQNFKSWQDTGDVHLAPLTALFGTNSSGKTSLLQFLLMLKQTTESADRSRVLHTGDDRTYVDLGTYYDLIFMHQEQVDLIYSLRWNLPSALKVRDPEGHNVPLFEISQLAFEATIRNVENRLLVEQFAYRFDEFSFGMRRLPSKNGNANYGYELATPNYAAKRNPGRPLLSLPVPVKSYGFPDQVNASYQNVGFLSDFVLAFEQLFHDIYYLGPLREYPSRQYIWAGEQPRDVGPRGELAIPALLASQRFGKSIRRGYRKPKKTVEEMVAYWLKELGLIHSFSLKPIAENRKDYEVRVKRSPRSAEVLITDVGFGVSQVLPVLALCYYAPEGATLIFEQPEIHLHPAVQSGLADIFIDTIMTRNIQIILESHSEHLLRRLQRRVAEEQLAPNQAALYFTTMAEDGTSHLQQLELDLFGNIRNWPQDFFGNDMDDLVEMTKAEMSRRDAAGAA